MASVFLGQSIAVPTAPARIEAIKTAIFAAGCFFEVFAADFFGVLGPYLPPPPPETPPPLLWGDEAHVRELFGDRVSPLEASKRELVETVPGTPADFCDFYRQTFGPVIALWFATIAAFGVGMRKPSTEKKRQYEVAQALE